MNFSEDKDQIIKEKNPLKGQILDYDISMTSTTQAYSINQHIQGYDINFNEKNNSSDDTFEQRVKYSQKQINIDLNILQNMKASDGLNLINNLIVDGDNFNLLLMKGVNQVLINVHPLQSCIEQEVQNLLDKIKALCEKDDLLLKPIFSELILNKNEQDSCYIYNITELFVKVTKFSSHFHSKQIKKIFKFASKLFQFFDAHDFLHEYKSEVFLDYIVLLADSGELRLDPMYFFDIRVIKKDLLFEYIILESEQKQHSKEEEESYEKITNYQCQSQQPTNQIKQTLVQEEIKCSASTVYSDQSILTRSQSSLQIQTSYLSNQSNQTLLQSNEQDQKLFKSFQKLFQSNQSLTQSNQLSKYVEFHYNSNLQTNLNEEPEKQPENCSEQLLDLEFDNEQKQLVRELIFNECLNSLSTSCSLLTSSTSDNQMLFLDLQGYSTSQINQKIYLAFVNLAKKIFYKHKFKQSLMLYSESPFYYNHFMQMKQEIKEKEQERFQQLHQKKVLQHSPFQTQQLKQQYNQQKQQQQQMMTDIKCVQVSLKEYLTKGIMTNPIRFYSCVRHQECYDLSSLKYLELIKCCLECKQQFGDYYSDKYLKFIADFVQKYNRQNSQESSNRVNNEQQLLLNYTTHLYQVSSVTCYIDSGLFLPEFDWNDFQSLQCGVVVPHSSQDQPEIPNFIDLEYLYQIVKFNTTQKEQLMLNQFSFFGFTDAQRNQPKQFISILHFREYSQGSSIRLKKLLNRKAFMEYPVRNCHQSCSHIDCFDLSDLLAVNSPKNFKENRILCPECKSEFKIDDLVLDKEYLKIINFAKQEQQFSQFKFLTIEDESPYIDLSYAYIDFEESTITLWNKIKQIDQILNNYYNSNPFPKIDTLSINQSSRNQWQNDFDMSKYQDEEDKYYQQKLFDAIIEGAQYDAAINLVKEEDEEQQQKNISQNLSYKKETQATDIKKQDESLSYNNTEEHQNILNNKIIKEDQKTVDNLNLSQSIYLAQFENQKPEFTQQNCSYYAEYEGDDDEHKTLSKSIKKPNLQ